MYNQDRRYAFSKHPLAPKKGPQLFREKKFIQERTKSEPYNLEAYESMSRAGTPTDNAAMESINGWIKAELFMDLHVTGEKPVKQEIDDYIVFFNEERPAYSLNYLTPKQYREAHVA